MKRARLALLFSAPALALITLAASCSDNQDAAGPTKPTSKYQKGKDAGPSDATIPDVAVPELDAAGLMDLQKDVKTIPQALSVILTAYDIDEAEANLGKANGTTPPLQAYSNDLLKDVKQSRARLRALYQSKDVTPRGNNLSDRLKFQSQAAEMNLGGIFRNMFNSSYAARRVQAEKDFLDIIEGQLQPVMETDDAFKAEIATIHEEVSRRADRAEALQSGVTNGTADGMFEEVDPPVPPAGPQAPQAPKPKPPADGGQ